MFEAKLNQAKLLKSIVDAVRETITEANFEISASGMELQSMDSAHVALVLLRLDAEGFEQYRCDRTFTLGVCLEWVSSQAPCTTSIHNRSQPHQLVQGAQGGGQRRLCQPQNRGDVRQALHHLRVSMYGIALPQ